MSNRTISGTIHHTVKLPPGEQLTITATGIVTPNAPGANAIVIRAHAAGDSILNSGMVFGATGASSSLTGGLGGAGIYALASANITNTGIIGGGAGGGGGHGGNGGVGVFLQGGTLTNAGTISGGAGGFGLGVRGMAGDAVQFGSAAARLVIDPGAVFNGNVVANSSVNDVLELANGANGTLAGLGQQFTLFQTIEEDAGATWILAGSNSVSSGSTFNVNGTVSVAGTLSNAGKVNVAGTFAVSGTLANSGSITGAYGSAATGFVGYTAVTLNAASALTNTGVITGGYGGYSINGGFGSGTYGPGGVGVSMSGGTLVNAGTIVGGEGTFGDGFTYGVPGGNAVNMTGGVLINSGTITGGDGNYGRDAVSPGTGGTGVNITGGTLTNSGTISGGSGSPFYSGIGGAGGTGVAISNAFVTNSGIIQGGQGGGAFDAYTGQGGTGAVLGAGAALNNLNSIIGGSAGTNHNYDYNGRDGGTGVMMSAGATLQNAGTINGGSASSGGYGGTGGIGVFSSGGTFTNTGTITGGLGGYGSGGGFGYTTPAGGTGGAGIDLHGSTLLNAGSITGGAGGAAGYGAGGGYGGAGALLSLGAVLTNTASISGGRGANANGAAASARPGAGGAGVYIDGGELITSGSVDGGSGGSKTGGASGAMGDSVLFGSAGGRLLVQAGAVFHGAVAADSAATCVLELGGTAAGTLSGLGTQFTGFSTISADAGVIWTLAGPNMIAAATSLIDQGTLVVQGSLTDLGALTIEHHALLQGQGSATFLGPITNGGKIAALSGSISLASLVTGSGTLAIGTGTTLSLLDGAASGQTANFLAASGALNLGNPLDFLGEIGGFQASDVVDLLNTVATGVSFNAGVLTVQDGVTTVAHLGFVGSYTTADFQLASDGSGGTLIKFI